VSALGPAFPASTRLVIASRDCRADGGGPRLPEGIVLACASTSQSAGPLIASATRMMDANQLTHHRIRTASTALSGWLQHDTPRQPGHTGESKRKRLGVVRTVTAADNLTRGKC